MGVSSYPNGFGASGVVIQNMPILNGYSNKVYWVGLAADGSAGSNGNDGSFMRPFATIDYAVSRCASNRGDIVMVKAGHTENVASATACNLDVIGVKVIGLGTGTDRPTLTFTSDGGKVTIDAANCLFKNIRLVPGATSDGMAVMLDINAAGAVVEDCRFSITTSQPLTVIDVAASCDRTEIRRNKITAPSAGTVKGIWFAGISDNCVVEDNDIEGDFSSAPIGVAEVIATKMIIRRNNVGNTDAVAHGIMMASSTGTAIDNVIYSPSAAYATSIVGASMRYVNNVASSTLGVVAVQVKSGAAA